MNLNHVRPKEARDIIRRAVDLGCTVDVTRRGHLRIATPHGGLVIASMTSSDHRSVRNLRSQLRREGVDI